MSDRSESTHTVDIGDLSADQLRALLFGALEMDQARERAIFGLVLAVNADTAPSLKLQLRERPEVFALLGGLLAALVEQSDEATNTYQLLVRRVIAGEFKATNETIN